MAVTATAANQQGTTISNIVQVTANNTTQLLAAVPVIRGKNASGPIWNQEHGDGTSVAHAEGAAFPAGTDKTPDQAVLGWGRYHTSIELTDEAVSDAEDGNPDDIKNLQARKIYQKIRKFLKERQVDMITGAGTTNNIAGLRLAVSDSNTYATVDQSSVTAFAATVDSTNGTPGTAAALTKEKLHYFIDSVEEKIGVSRDQLILCGSGKVATQLFGLYEGQVSYSSQGNLGGVRPNVLADGLRVLRCNDATYTGDDSTKGSLYCLYIDWDEPENGLHWQVRPYKNKPQVRMDGLPFGMQILETPQDAHASKWTLRSKLQLVLPSPGTCGVLNDIAI